MILKTLFITILIYQINISFASKGDKSIYFRECLAKTIYYNCTLIKIENEFNLNQPIYLQLLGWNCYEESKYECMWKTVDYFVDILKADVPQFYGKWPFIRILGIQEIASVLASLIHFIINLYYIRQLSIKISKYSYMKYLWIGFGLVSLNTWLWSIIFHIRDVPFTEKMDYFSAFALVLYQFNAFFIRLFIYNKIKYSNHLIITISLFCLAFYFNHVYYLTYTRFDYGYNMRINILFGILNSFCWLIWSLYSYFKLKLKYTWKCVLSILLIDFLMLLEIFDFKPILWLIDSHALWHFTTIIVPFYWYPFFIDDTNYNLFINTYNTI